MVKLPTFHSVMYYSLKKLKYYVKKFFVVEILIGCGIKCGIAPKNPFDTFKIWWFIHSVSRPYHIKMYFF